MRLYTQATDELPQRLREVDTRISNMRRQITNLTNAIAEVGHSAALLKQLTACEVQEAELKEDYDQLAHLIASKPTVLSPQRIQRLAAQFERVFEAGTIEEQRAILAGWVHDIRAERIDRQIRARVEIYVPPANGPDPPETKLGQQSVLPWRHLLVDLICETTIRYKTRGWHVKKTTE